MTLLDLRLTACSLIPALLLGLAGCSSEDLGPTDQALVGRWGSPDAELIAIQAGAELRYGCSTVVIRRPIALAPDLTFAARGEWHGSGAQFGGFPVVTVVGAIHDAQVHLAVRSPSGEEGVTYVLQMGVTRAPSEIPECPV